MSPGWLWLALLGCAQLEGLVGGAEEVPATAPPAVGDAPAPADPVAAVRKALAAGARDQAVIEAEKALASRPADDAAWDLLELAALRSGDPGAVLDRLSADTPVGGRADRHHALRATLALEAKRPADAMAAATALLPAAPGDAAAFATEALLQGANPPADAPADWSSLANLRRDPSLPWDPVVDALPGERAALARARAHLARGAPGLADAELTKVSPTSLPLREARARLVIEASPDPAAGWALVSPTLQALVDAGDLLGAASLAGSAAPLACGGWKGEELVALAGAGRKAAIEAKHAEAAARFAAAESEAALRTGQPALAVEAATVAAGHAATKSRGQWLLALAHAARGDDDGVEAAATGLPADRLQAVQDLAAAMHGENPVLPSPGIEGDDAALQALLGAGWLRAPAPAREQAARLAGRSGDLRYWAMTALGRSLHEVDDEPAGHLGAELALRYALAPRATEVPAPEAGAEGDGGLPQPHAAGHPDGEAWVALVTGKEVPGDHPLAAWTRARAAIRQGDGPTAAAQLAALSTLVPPWRSGPLAPVLVFDGPTRVEVAALFEEATALADPSPVDVVRHGWVHRDDTALRAWSSGASLVPPGADGAGRAVWDAAARYRHAALAWLAVGGDYPVAARAALVEAERKAGLNANPVLSLSALQDALGPSAGLSFLRTGVGFEVLVVTSRGARRYDLPRQAEPALAAYLAGLRQGTASVAAGDAARESILDPLMESLLGLGDYRLVGALPLSLAPVEAFPEQHDGVRYLSSIRKATHHPDFESLVTGPEPGENFTLTFVGLFRAEEEATEYRRLFPDGKVLAGKDATVAAWRADAPNARFLAFGDLEAAPGGGFRLPSGETLHLGDLGAVPLVARSATVAGDSAPEHLLARATALQRAGVRDVLLADWPAPASFREALLLRYWEGITRRQPPSRALQEARKLALQGAEGQGASPATWAAFRLVAAR